MGRKHERGDFEVARDRLFREIHRCEVLGADDDAVTEWLDDTIDYLALQFPTLTPDEREELKSAGRNYVAPVIPHGEGKDATNREEWTSR